MTLALHGTVGMLLPAVPAFIRPSNAEPDAQKQVYYWRSSIIDTSSLSCCAAYPSVWQPALVCEWKAQDQGRRPVADSGQMDTLYHNLCGKVRPAAAIQPRPHVGAEESRASYVS